MLFSSIYQPSIVSLVIILLSSFTTIDEWRMDKNRLAKPISNSRNANSSYEIQGTAYITLNRRLYHSTKDCTILKISTMIRSVSLQEVINQDKSDVCNLCVN